MPNRITFPLNLFSVIAIAALSGVNATGKTVNLKGRVLDKANMEPVAGASVKVSGSGLAAVTGADGRFVLKRGSAKTGKVDVTMDKLVPKSIDYAADSADLGDIVLDYPARTTIGVGSAMPYGAYVLFDGSKGKAAAQAEMKAKWQDWIPVGETGAELAKYTAASNTFKIAKDPQYPNDTNRVTLMTCCNRIWGYDDLQSIKTHGDAQIHVEFNLMGQYDGTENPNVSDPISPSHAPGYNNSGVYVQSRYEVQILSWNQDSTKLPDIHGMASLVDDYPVTKNANKPNGIWQSYDVTFRSARYDAQGNRTEHGRITVWWNGVVVHDNREAHATATGGHSGEDMNPTLFGLKFQSEGTDVRYRNVWIKDLNIKDAQTNFGY